MWYNIVEKMNEVAVEFAVREDSGDDRHWTLAEVAAKPLVYDFRGRNVEISGKAALWMYAHAALRSFAGGAASIAVFNAMSQKRMLISPLAGASGAPEIRSSLFNISGTGDDCYILHIAARTWEPGNLAQFRGYLADWLAEAGRGVKLVIDAGARCPNWLLAFVALECQRSGVASLEYFDIRDSVAIDLRSLGQRPFEMPDNRQKHRVAVGVVGDPNSGKSVFSTVFKLACEAAGLVSWSFDADRASPTPSWYLSPERGGAETGFDAAEERQRQKLKWNAAMEREAAREIRNTTQYQDILIVDLPGGNHARAEGPLRIPPGREVLLQDIDFFIIIDRSAATDIAAAWTADLACHGLDSRVIAVLRSCDHRAPFRFYDVTVEDGIFRAAVDGLDRSLFAAEEALTAETLSPLRPLIEQIVQQKAELRSKAEAALADDGGTS